MSSDTGADSGGVRAGADTHSHVAAARHNQQPNGDSQGHDHIHHDHVHGDRHGHTHDLAHGHGDHHHEVHSGAARVLPKPQAPGLSLMRASLGERLLLAAGLSALLWGAIAGVLWA